MRRFILWDNDGILVDTEYWYFKATQQALADLGIPLEQSSYVQRMARGESSWDLAHAAGIDPDKVAAQVKLRDALYLKHLTQENIDVPGVEQVLEKLATTCKMAIVTTSKRTHFDAIHRGRNLTRHMEFVLTREDYVSSKPDPEPYLLALSTFGATAEECLVVEDSSRGLQSALAAGIDCAVVYNNFTVNQDFTGARYRLDAIGELPGIITARGY